MARVEHAPTHQCASNALSLTKTPNGRSSRMADPRQIVGLTGENREAHKASTTATGPADHITSGASDANAANPSRAGCLPVCLDDRSVN